MKAKETHLHSHCVRVRLGLEDFLVCHTVFGLDSLFSHTHIRNSPTSCILETKSGEEYKAEDVEVG